jgi:hypothetical protein
MQLKCWTLQPDFIYQDVHGKISEYYVGRRNKLLKILVAKAHALKIILYVIIGNIGNLHSNISYADLHGKM